MSFSSVDVGIVGAGLSGLRLAGRLRSSGKSVLLLEVKDRIGGRILNQTIPDKAVGSL
jgi:monoamine oxidase